MARRTPAERRARLIDAAVRVIAAHGVEGATTRRIAAAAEMSLASLHYLFESKEALFFAIWEEQVRALKERAEADAHRDGLAPTAARLLRQTFDWFESDQEFAQVQLEITFWALRRDAALGVGTYDLHVGLMEAALRAGRLADEPEDRIGALARLIVALADGISVQWFCYRDPDRLAADIDAAQVALAAFTQARRP
ncbi:TetR/AcrR family transcriptional regulator [Nakamurella endophytica]|uniref:TetR/AcrR family transcriptional regulator n=1 Tax=Nakamurella endophytica TaxID=1748367 RepID=UPI001663DC38|nr:TetR/AcrR family transcriptional regulator [Nakamurella endophytica]